MPTTYDTILAQPHRPIDACLRMGAGPQMRDLLTDQPLYVGPQKVCSDPQCAGPDAEQVHLRWAHEVTKHHTICEDAAEHPLVKALARWAPLVDITGDLDWVESLLNPARRRERNRLDTAARFMVSAVVALGGRSLLDLAAADPVAAAAREDLLRRADSLRARSRRSWRSGPRWSAGDDELVLVRSLPALRTAGEAPVVLALRRAISAWPVVHVHPGGQYLVLRAPDEIQPWQFTAHDQGLLAFLDPVEEDIPPIVWDLFDILVERTPDHARALEVAVETVTQNPDVDHTLMLTLTREGLHPEDAVTATRGITA